MIANPPHWHNTSYSSNQGKLSAVLCSPLPSYNTCIHIFTLSPPHPLRCRDSFVTKMNLSSAQQPKQVIWLPQPQIKLVWFNFRFGLLLQPYIKGDIFHYTAKTRERRGWGGPLPPQEDIMEALWHLLNTAAGPVRTVAALVPIVGLVSHRATLQHTTTSTCGLFGEPRAKSDNVQEIPGCTRFCSEIWTHWARS